ncbi:MAG: RidA family protein [Bacteroidota bacterium]
MKKVINSSNAPAPIGPYSQSVLVNGFLFVSGQIPLDAKTGELIIGDISIETQKVMNNLEAILLEAGATWNNVVKCSIFIKNMSDFGKINDIYGKYFPENPPARETVEVSRLPKDVNVEISLIAAI